MMTRSQPAGEPRVAPDLIATGIAALDMTLSGDVPAVYREARRFFAQSEEQRLSASLPRGCGYLPFGREHSGDAARPDHVDTFVASPRMAAVMARVPSEPARALYVAMMAVFDALEVQAEGILTSIAGAVGGTAMGGRLGGGFRSWSILQINHARPIAAGRLVNEPHEDGHLLTFAHATALGLELEVSGNFVQPGHTTDEMVVMPGHALSLLTGGMIPSLRHRVVAHEGGEPRLSLMFFADLNPLLCTPWRSTAFNAGVDIGAFVRGNSRRFGVEGLGPE